MKLINTPKVRQYTQKRVDSRTFGAGINKLGPIIMWTRTIILFLLWTQIVSGQNDSIKDRIILKLSPLPIIDLFNSPSLRLGPEIKINDKLSFSAEYGMYLPTFVGLKNITGQTIKVELKKYIRDNHAGSKAYCSLEYFYKDNAYDVTDTITETPKYAKTHRYHKYNNCLSIKFGVLSFKKKNFIVEYYAGVGVKYKNVNSGLTSDEFSKTIKSTDPYGQMVSNYRDEVGKIYRLYIDVGFKIGLGLK